MERCATSLLTTAGALAKDRTQPTAPSFQHRHYAEIARIIRGMFPHATTDAPYQRKVAQHFAAELAHTNPRFDRARFLRACGVESEQ